MRKMSRQTFVTSHVVFVLFSVTSDYSLIPLAAFKMMQHCIISYSFPSLLLVRRFTFIATGSSLLVKAIILPFGSSAYNYADAGQERQLIFTSNQSGENVIWVRDCGTTVRSLVPDEYFKNCWSPGIWYLDRIMLKTKHKKSNNNCGEQKRISECTTNSNLVRRSRRIVKHLVGI